MSDRTEEFSTSAGDYAIMENDQWKVVKSENYNTLFNKKNGFFARWGKTKEDDPDFLPFGIEIADIEVTTSCAGPAGAPCSFCYKSNTPRGDNMTIETFIKIFNKLPRTLTQVAFGADATLKSNPDIWKMFDYCRNNDYNQVVPNVTVANINDETAQKLAAVCGAVAVSRYSNKDWCYDSVKRLTDAGMTQVNIHMMIAEETYDMALETIRDYHTDPRLKSMNAIVFLSLKQVGRGGKYHQLSFDKFKSIIDLTMELKVKFGFDSCSQQKFIRAVADHPNFTHLNMCAEPCESSLFSLYIDQKGELFPCSFSPGSEDWDEGIDMLKVDDFIEQAWNNPRYAKFREKLLGKCRSCPLFEI